MRFEHDTLAQRIRFSAGDAAAALRAEVDRLGAARVMVIARDAEAERITAGLPVALLHTEVAMHVPLPEIGRAHV